MKSKQITFRIGIVVRLVTVLGMMATMALPCAVPLASAEIKILPLFSDHMVLQRNTMDPVWGEASAHASIRVSIAGQTVHTTADGHGHWMIKLKPMAAGGPYTLRIDGRSSHRVIRDVLIGEVWLSSGQSNMQFELVSNSPKFIATSDPKMRMLTVPFASCLHARHSPAVQWRRSSMQTVKRNGFHVPKRQLQGRWKPCTAKTAAKFSAVAYFFGSYLRQHLHVPIGIIDNSVGGSVADTWTSLAAMRGIQRLKPIVHHYERIVKSYSVALHVQQTSGRFTGKKKPALPYVAYTPYWWEHPAHLLNGMLLPLIPYRIRGVIWYQGEFNANRAWQYRQLLPTMIADWRTRWGQGNFPFYIVQLPGFLRPAATPQDPSWARAGWAEMREAQAHVARVVHNCGLVVTIDTVNPKFGALHPPHKRPVGQRLARLALAKVYQQKLVYSGPVFAAMHLQGHEAQLQFRHIAGGITSHGHPIIGFAIAGKDRKFYWGYAEIQGNTVVVSSKYVAHPAAVRYAWGNMPQCSLFNKAGLPMAPFRTDRWTEWTQHTTQHD